MSKPNDSILSLPRQSCDPPNLRDEADRSLRTKEAGRFLGYSHKTLNNWRVLGCGPRFAKCPGKNGAVRYRLGDLVEWRNALLRSSTSNDMGV